MKFRVRCAVVRCFAVLAIVLAGSWAAAPPLDAKPLSGETVADLVVVEKAARVLILFRNGRELKRYRIALGGEPHGHKRQEGDNRTPEGRYLLDWRNPRSQFNLSLHISYPNEADKAQARARGVSPGGDIFVHGQPRALGADYAGLVPGDWTAGCIAVGNAEMREIWRAVPDRTPIEIRP